MRVWASVEPFRSFDTAFQRSLGFGLTLRAKIDQKQCPAISFLSQLRREGARAPHLDIDRETLRNGDVLSGMVDHYGDRQVALILVSDSGTVQNVSNLLKPGTDAKTFNTELKAEGARRAPAATVDRGGKPVRPSALFRRVSPARRISSSSGF